MSGNLSMKSSMMSEPSFNTQNTSIIQTEQDIRIRWICSFLDGRTHIQFNDKSGLILHKGHECFSYFSKMGNKLRFMSRNIPCTESIEYKVNLAFKHLNQYNDVPTIKSEKLYGEEEEILNSQKISSCIWNIKDDSNEHIEVDEEGNISIVSVEGYAKLTLLKNKFVFNVEYLQLIPKKRAAWESKLNHYDEDNEDDDNEYQGGDQENGNKMNTKLNSNKGGFDFHKDFLQKYNLKKQSNDQNKNKGKIKLAYPYIRLKKMYTIFSFPQRWTLPLFLLWQKLESKQLDSLLGLEDLQLIHHPNFQQDFLDYIHNDISSDSYEDIAFKNYIREKYGLNKINPTEAITELPNIGMLSQIQHKNISSECMWSGDEVFPQFDQPRYSNEIFYAWKDDYSVWISDNYEVYLFNQKDSLFNFSTQNGKFFHEVEQNTVKSMEDEKVINVIQVWREDAKSQLLSQFAKLREHDAIIAEKTAAINQQKEGKRFQREVKQSQDNDQEENIASLYSDNYEILHQCENEYGKFEAFKNGCIKILFRDRTILRWMKGSDKIHIITRFGDQINVLVQAPQEFQEYADRAIEFREYCFTNPKEKLEKEMKQQELNEMISFEMNKNERFLTILKGKVPADFRNIVTTNDQTISKQYNPCNSNSSQTSQNDLSYTTPMKISNVHLQNNNQFNNSQQQYNPHQSHQEYHQQDMNEMIQKQFDFFLSDINQLSFLINIKSMLKTNEAMLKKLKQVV